jgi:prophage DNA circulation protein
MDLLQITIIFVLVILTLVAVGVGVYLVLVLKELRETVRKANGVLDDVHDVTGAVSSPIATIAGIVSGLADSLKAVKSVNNLFDKPKKKGGK